MITVEDCQDLRRKLEVLTDRMRGLVLNEPSGEAIADVMLAYRHLEDASMRLDKLVQRLKNPSQESG